MQLTLAQLHVPLIPTWCGSHFLSACHTQSVCVPISWDWSNEWFGGSASEPLALGSELKGARKCGQMKWNAKRGRRSRDEKRRQAAGETQLEKNAKTLHPLAEEEIMQRMQLYVLMYCYHFVAYSIHGRRGRLLQCVSLSWKKWRDTGH